MLTLVILAGLPWVLGGRLELGKFAYACGVFLLAIVWNVRHVVSARSTLRWTGTEWLLTAMVGLVVIQILPLPIPWQRCISPNQEVVIPLWSEVGRTALEADSSLALPQLKWSTLSFTPEATRFGLLVLVAHGAFFWITCQRLRSLDDVRRLLQQMAASAIIMSIFGLLQYFSGTDKFAWCFSHPSRDASTAASGPFVNPNHFSSFLALGLGPMLWWLQSLVPAKAACGPTGNMRFQAGPSDMSQLRFVAAAAGIVIILFAAGMSRSRGGILAVAVSGACYVGCGALWRMIDWRICLTIAVVGCILGAGLAIHGHESVTTEMATLTSGSLNDLDAGHARRRLWQANLAVASQFPWLGTGIGSHLEVYPLVYDRPHVDYTHAESCYVQLLTESGRIGIVILALSILRIISWLWRGLQQQRGSSRLLMAIAFGSSVVGSMTHAVFDFPWYLTSCMSLSLASLAGLWSLTQDLSAHDTNQVQARKTEETLQIRWQPQRLIVAGVILGTCIPVLQYAAGWGIASWHWNEYLVMSLDPDAKAAHRALLSKPETDAANRRVQEAAVRIEGMIEELAQVLKWAPRHPAANLKLATLLLAAFDEQQLHSDNAMALVHIRDAAYASQFTDLATQTKWLEAAVGENLQLLRKAATLIQRGLANSPLSGQGYLLWSEVAFLNELNPKFPQLLLDLGERVRPFHAGIHYQLGLRAAASQDLSGMTEHWQKAFHYDLDYAAEIIRSLSPIVDAASFMQMFAPRGNELKTLMYYYYKIGKPDQMKVVAQAVIEQTEKLAATKVGSELADVRLQLVQHHLLIGDNDGAIQEAESATRAAPNKYEPHLVLATQLVAGQKFDEAMREVAWCMRRRPQDKRVRELQATLEQRKSRRR